MNDIEQSQAAFMHAVDANKEKPEEPENEWLPKWDDWEPPYTPSWRIADMTCAILLVAAVMIFASFFAGLIFGVIE